MRETFLTNGSSYGHTQPYSSRELELTQQYAGRSSLVGVLASRVLGLARQLHCKLSGPERFVEAATTIVIAISVRSVAVPIVFGGATFSTFVVEHCPNSICVSVGFRTSIQPLYP